MKRRSSLAGWSETIAIAFVCLALACVMAAMLACATLSPMLQAWATNKAARVAVCMADKAISERRAALDCLGPFADDRRTYACERANAYLATLPESS